jgi:hypothetical protein
MKVTELGIVIECRLEQDSNTPYSVKLRLIVPIEMTELGIMTDVKFVHLAKAPLPREVSESGIMTDVKPEHPLKALLSIDVTEFGIATDVKPEQP